MLATFDVKEFEEFLYEWEDAPDLEDVIGDSKAQRFRWFVEYCDRHGMSGELVVRLSEARRHIQWPEC